ncbi:hypothetical protein [Ruminococcus sp.]|uniref:hypothetical protein n=1 Tax=Ruminococcus sp. TaxID=41978 RepID=UPI003F0167C7
MCRTVSCYGVEQTESVLLGALYGLSSAEAAENIYHKGLAKMKEKLQKKGIFHA